MPPVSLDRWKNCPTLARHMRLRGARLRTSFRCDSLRPFFSDSRRSKGRPSYFSGKGIYGPEDTMDPAARLFSDDQARGHFSWSRFAESLDHAPLGTIACVGTHLPGGGGDRWSGWPDTERSVLARAHG